MEAVGLRVVRGSDWIWGGQDGGEGYVGTVVRPCKSQNNTFVNGCTFILWDSGQLANYRVGHKNSYDLYVLDTSLIGMINFHVTVFPNIIYLLTSVHSRVKLKVLMWL